MILELFSANETVDQNKLKTTYTDSSTLIFHRNRLKKKTIDGPIISVTASRAVLFKYFHKVFTYTLIQHCLHSKQCAYLWTHKIAARAIFLAVIVVCCEAADIILR